jgi:Rad3-related DNA helicase
MASISIVETRTSEGFVLLNVTGAAFSDGVDGNGNDVLVAKVPIPPV